MKISITNNGCVVLIGIMTIIVVMVILINAPAEGAADPGIPIVTIPTPTPPSESYPAPIPIPTPDSYPADYHKAPSIPFEKTYTAEPGPERSLWAWIWDLFTN